MTAPSNPSFSNIPQELKERPHWVNWGVVERDGKATKLPLDAHNGKNASCDDPSTWSDFEVALERLQKGKADGVGFQITPPYVGIDLDKCRNPETGQIEAWAQEIIEALSSYTELSPSGTGIHIWVKSKLPPGARRKDRIEMYERGRYFALTGAHVDGTPPTIEERTAELVALHERIFESPQQPATAPSAGPNIELLPCSATSVGNRPVDRVLASLKNVHAGGEPGQWSAQCPAHDDEHSSLSVGEGADGKVLLKCHAGCKTEDIVGALALRMSDLFPGLTVAQYAEAKKLPLDLLHRWGLRDTPHNGRSAVKIPYADLEGKKIAAVRFRLSLNGADKFRWREKDQPCPYGLWMLPDARKAGYVVLVEGESDCHTLWYQGVPALGVPGADAWKEDWQNSLKDIPTVYAVIEPDKGGETFRRRLLQSPSLRSRLRLVSLDGAKDPSELHVKDPEGFETAWQAAVANATPPPDVDGEALLRAVEEYFTRYAVLEKGLPLVLALWSVATHLFERFDAFPYLAITSPTKRCGKTRVGELLGFVCANPESTVGISPAALFRIIQAKKPTLILDEAESLSGKSERTEALREILNAGYRKGKKVRRCAEKGKDGGYKLEEFETFSPKAITLIGNLPDTLADRCIPVRMKRRVNEVLARFRFALVEKEGAGLQTKMAEWAAAKADEVTDYYLKNDLPFLSDRDAELWLPLFAVLFVADRTRLTELEATARQLSDAKSVNEPTDLGIKLLADLRQIFSGATGAKQTRTETLLTVLHNLSESQWGSFAHGKPLDGRGLGRLLKRFGILSKNIRPNSGNKVVKGYLAKDFEDAWSRYLPLPSATTATSLAFHEDRGESGSVTGTLCSGSESGPKPFDLSSVADVADKAQPDQGNESAQAIAESDDGLVLSSEMDVGSDEAGTLRVIYRGPARYGEPFGAEIPEIPEPTEAQLMKYAELLEAEQPLAELAEEWWPELLFWGSPLHPSRRRKPN